MTQDTVSQDPDARCSRWLQGPTIQRVALVLAVIVLPLLYLAREAFWNPAVAFLPPSPRADWAVAWEHEWVNYYAMRNLDQAEFVNSYHCDAPPSRLELEIRAFGSMQVLVNGREIAPVAKVGNWKNPSRYDLAPWLRPGDNDIRVFVTNPRGIGAILVETPNLLRTPGQWSARVVGAKDSQEVLLPSLLWRARLWANGETHLEKTPLVGDTPVYSPVDGPFRTMKHPPYLDGPLQMWKGWAVVKWLAVAWLLLVVLLLVAVCVRRWLVRAPAATAQLDYSKTVKLAVPALLIGACIALGIWDTARCHFLRENYDATHHLAYVQLLAQSWRAPTIADGPMMYQPPAYYYVAAAVYRLFGGDNHAEAALKAVQFLGFLAGLGLALLAWLYARLLFPNSHAAQWAALAFAVFLPMRLYKSPQISNEMFAAFLIGLTLYYLLRWGFDGQLTLAKSTCLGLLAGASLMSKYTGLFVLVAGLGVLGMNALSMRRRRDWLMCGVYLAVALALCSLWYARNATLFGRLFVGPWDLFSGFRANPTWRTLGFYTQFGRVFFHHPALSPFESFLDGIYGSLWADSHLNLFRQIDERAQFGFGLVLILAALPTMVVLVGFGRTLASAIRNPSHNRDVLLLAVPVWTSLALVAFTMQIPEFTSVKAFYLMSLVPCLAVFLARGREWLEGPLRWARYTLDGTLAVICVLLFGLFSTFSTNDADSEYNWAVVLHAQGRTEEAMAHYGQAIRINPECVEAHNNLANLLYSRGRIDAAVVHYREVLRLKPDNPVAHNNLALALQSQGKFDEALAQYGDSLKIKPNSAGSHYNLGVALQEQGRLEDAVAQYTEALRLDPNCAEAHNNWGNLLLAQGKVDDAIAHLRLALKIRPEYVDAHVNLGFVCQHQGQIDEAAARYAEALRINPNDVQAHINWASMSLGQGNNENALLHYSEALKLQPHRADAWAGLCVSYAGLHQTAKAWEAFRQLEKLDPARARQLKPQLPPP